ncbi:hypothetical protein GOBAR_AA38937 [Gossypium barbadense]|uniref:AP180 N-terminal homology (ANTH) domain-containing protein n=1 Tax=Gossypium barbadense TaxID=3634 RepID=A0A2P5VSG8_GOSBA|nr:hypothetical protein GOBAR_AA38937 [Gossypium barbadense]
MPSKLLIYTKRAGQQAESLAEFYEYCKGLDLARNFQFPTLRQPPPSFLATMEEYIKEAPQTSSVQNRLEYEQREESPPPADGVEEKQEPQPLVSLASTDDLLGLNEINPRALELEESNALALAIVPSGNESTTNRGLNEISGTGWELALVTAPSNHTAPPGGGFDKLLLDSLYEDDAARRQLQLKNAGYGYGYGTNDDDGALSIPSTTEHSPF